MTTAQQLTLPKIPAAPVYDPDADNFVQRKHIWELMKDGGWWTLVDLEKELHARGQHYMITSISSRVRDFRKKQFGGFTVERRAIAGRLFEYRIVR
jgi:hypothetical protein